MSGKSTPGSQVLTPELEKSNAEMAELFRQHHGLEDDPMMDQLLEPEEIVPWGHDRATDGDTP